MSAGVVFGGLLLALLAVWVHGILRLIRRAHHLRIWPHATARILEKRSWLPAHRRVVVFQLPDGRPVTGRIVVSSLPAPSRAAEDSVPIAYDQGDPARCVEVLSRNDLVIRLAAESIAIAGAAGAIVWGQSKR
ncbi:hypothetical protein [Roseomonas fluvialis]|uniref:DUF3592 domain-containing protein n=1 Tax=Roseomonas fluvialis TaxID=1750527 RepID=A0ABM7XX81_9PROT|nr:hypothetical protein [Roseomonas fluvialis]BDG70074.1 hypothetical protein Rmf_00030 [Roseomonas fluvialis]